MAFMIEMLKVQCPHCGEDVLMFPRSQEELNNFVHETCSAKKPITTNEPINGETTDGEDQNNQV